MLKTIIPLVLLVSPLFAAEKVQQIPTFATTIVSNPDGAVLSLDGQLIADCLQTPCSVRIEGGDHRIVAVKDGFAEIDSTVFVGSEHQEIVLNLKPDHGVFEFVPQLLANVGDPNDLKITVDGMPSDQRKMSLTVGTHSVVAQHPCYDPLTLNVTVLPGEMESFTGPMTRGMAGLVLYVEQGSQRMSVPVFVDGKEVGTTPYVGEVPVCSEITIGDARAKVPVKLQWHETTEYIYEIPENGFAAIVPEPEKQEQKTDSVAQQEPVRIDSVEQELLNERPEKKAAENETPNRGGALAKFRMGLHAAATYNTWWGDDSNDTWGIGVNAGIGLLIPFNQIVGLQLGPEYSLRRLVGSVEYAGEDIDVETTLMYIDVPVLVRAQLARYFYMNLGPMVSFNLTANESVDIENKHFSEDVSEYFNVFEANLVVGFGVTPLPARRPLDVDFKFILGLMNIPNSDEVEHDISCKNMQFSVGLTYWFL